MLLLLFTAAIAGAVLYLFKFRKDIAGSHLTDTKVTSEYHKLYEADNENTEQERKKDAWSVTQKYYDMVTDFYLYGWGRSFHFAVRHERESLKESICRYEHRLAYDLGLKPGMKVLDIGCGVMGPAVEIARFSGASITGVNYHPYQVKKAKEFIKQVGMDHLCDIVRGDFNKLDEAGLQDNTYDAAYAIESTCHGKDRAHTYSEILRKLKPGATFAAMEWVMTDKYDPKNEEHNQIKFNIMKGDGLPEILTKTDIEEALKKAGFEVVSLEDKAVTSRENPVPWWLPLDNGGWEFTNWFQTTYGRYVVHKLVGALEALKLVPPSSQQGYEFLMAGAEGLRDGGKLGIFTPSYFVVARKPLSN
ncbi:hypothetical protein ABK040_003580 [Willaertia magna]